MSVTINRKSYTVLRLVPTWMTLNDLERRNSPYFALLNSIALQAYYVTVVENRPISTEYRFPLLATTGPRCSAALCDS